MGVDFTDTGCDHKAGHKNLCPEVVKRWIVEGKMVYIKVSVGFGPPIGPIPASAWKWRSEAEYRQKP